MAVKDIIPIKYWIPKLDFTVRLGTSQYFKVMYKIYTDDWNNDTGWTVLREQYLVQPDGTTSESDKLVLSNLVENRTYVLRLVDNRSKNFDFKFKTGRNVALGDSPYYNKLLMPGQIYDWFIPNMDGSDAPNKVEAEWYYRANGKKGVSMDVDNWGSLISYEQQAGDVINPMATYLDTEQVTDKYGVSAMGFAFNNKNALVKKYLSTPNLRFQNGSYVAWHAYWTFDPKQIGGDDSGGGGVTGREFGTKFTGFMFLIKEYDGDENDERTLVWIDGDKYYNEFVYNGVKQYKFGVTAAGKFFVEYSKGTIVGVNEDAHLVLEGPYRAEDESGFIVEKNVWYFIDYGGLPTAVYRKAKEDETPNADPEFIPTGGEELSAKIRLGTAIKVASPQFKRTTDGVAVSISDITIPYQEEYLSNQMTPLLFGGEDTDQVLICKIAGGPNGGSGPVAFNSGGDSETTNRYRRFYSKICDDKFASYQLRYTITFSGGNTQTLLQETKFTSSISNEKISFLVDPDIFQQVIIPAGNTIRTVRLDILNYLGVSVANKIFSGFDNVGINGTTHYDALMNPEEYVQDSFKIVFAEQDEPVKALAEYFFTKHGTWGGYNGGTNGHNIYFNGQGNLVIENHGDKYTGTIRGVCKEADVKPFTGYGADVDYSGNSWDSRTNKNFLRVGAALVSNRYFGYGKVDVMLKLPVGCWGVCPAIWLFHYIEISESDYRYSQYPYNQRNAQGSADDGYYRVVNNEIDIELPSQLTNGTIDSWSVLPDCYFDMNIITEDLVIGVKNGSEEDTGLFRLTDITKPKQRDSWVKVGPVIVPRYEPSFANCKFNNWVGERESGQGWAAPVYEGGSIKYTAEEVYKGKEGTNILKEEYCSQLLKLSNSLAGYADDKFHKWSIVWLPDRTLLYVDDIFISENRGFVPFNQMKLTIAGWFPTMPVAYRVTEDEDGNQVKTPIGVTDRDGIHVTPGSVMTILDDTANTSIGTWAGTQANWQVCQMEVQSVEYLKYNAGESIVLNGKTSHITEEPMALGESFPESGLRYFITP